MGAAVTTPFAEHGSRNAFVRSPAYMNLDDGHMREEWETILQVIAVNRPMTICRQSLWSRATYRRGSCLAWHPVPHLRVIERWPHYMLGCICSGMHCLHTL